jgi:hypothetical protein
MFTRYPHGVCKLAKRVDRVIEVVVGDVHGRSEALRRLLGAVGTLDADGARNPDCWIVQLGDLLDRRASRIGEPRDQASGW